MSQSNQANQLRDQFVAGMSACASTVNIVTTNGASGRGGVTVSAMSSVSADTPKPTLLICVNQQSYTAAKIIENGTFCVNVLRDDQAEIAEVFAGRTDAAVEARFDCASWAAMPSGAERVVDPLVAFDCRVSSSSLVGTHHVFFGEVGQVYLAAKGSPLLYARRAYGIATGMNDPE